MGYIGYRSHGGAFEVKVIRVQGEIDGLLPMCDVTWKMAHWTTKWQRAILWRFSETVNCPFLSTHNIYIYLGGNFNYQHHYTPACTINYPYLGLAYSRVPQWL